MRRVGPSCLLLASLLLAGLLVACSPDNRQWTLRTPSADDRVEVTVRAGDCNEDGEVRFEARFRAADGADPIPTLRGTVCFDYRVETDGCTLSRRFTERFPRAEGVEHVVDRSAMCLAGADCVEGRCEEPAGTDAGVDDAGPMDAGPTDAGMDGGMDASPRDAGPPDAARDAQPDAAADAATDAGPLDAGPLDAAPIDAAPIDAGPCPRFPFGYSRVWALTAGDDHGCAIVATAAGDRGPLYCWGEPSDGKLGHGGDGSVAEPVGSETDWIAVSAGDRHTCGLRVGGTLHCWGDQTDGRLGNGETSGSAGTPQPIVGGPAAPYEWVSLGHGTGCAGSAAGVDCWGVNELVRSGDTLNRLLGLSDADAGTSPVVSRPAAVFDPASGTVAPRSGLSIGGSVQCQRGPTSGPNLFCWGVLPPVDASDTLPFDCGLYATTPRPVLTDGVFSASSVGNGFLCGVLDGGGEVVCRGHNNDNQLGFSGTDCLLDPSSAGNRVQIGVGIGLDLVETVSSGEAHSCAIRTGDVYCWGRVASGRTGQASGSPFARPLLDPITNATHVAAGRAHSCVGTSDPSVRCFGRGLEGQLGRGATVAADPVPADVCFVR